MTKIKSFFLSGFSELKLWQYYKEGNMRKKKNAINKKKKLFICTHSEKDNR